MMTIIEFVFHVNYRKMLHELLLQTMPIVLENSFSLSLLHSIVVKCRSKLLVSISDLLYCTSLAANLCKVAISMSITFSNLLLLLSLIYLNIHYFLLDTYMKYV